MKLSKENFVKFIGTRLTPESSKSYLTYVDAFSRALDKGDSYYFESANREKELKALLQGGINEVPSFTKYSKKYQSNIKTGIRALLKYYLFEQDSNKKKSDYKIPDRMTQDNILEHYSYKYRNWLKSRVIKLNGEKFLSYDEYSKALQYAILDSKLTPREFFSFTKKMQVDIFQIQLGDTKNFQNRTKTSRGDMTSSINKYKLYLAEKFGEKSKRLY